MVRQRFALIRVVVVVLHETDQPVFSGPCLGLLKGKWSRADDAVRLAGTITQIRRFYRFFRCLLCLNWIWPKSKSLI